VDQRETSGISAFRNDIASHRGYVYSTGSRLSSRMANSRLTEAVIALADFRARRVLDIGCGDGTFTVELLQRSGASRVVGVDPAKEAVELAREKGAGLPLEFSVGNAYHLPFQPDSFDIACLRGVLHHMDRPCDAVREAFRVAPALVVVEPNGYNPGVKILERLSPYHIRHRERSFSARTLNKWVRETGGLVTAFEWCGLVPMFCPDWLARAAKSLEPAVERMPLARNLLCAVYAFRADRNDS